LKNQIVLCHHSYIDTILKDLVNAQMGRKIHALREGRNKNSICRRKQEGRNRTLVAEISEAIFGSTGRGEAADPA
jgi:hypothetical protein